MSFFYRTAVAVPSLFASLAVWAEPLSLEQAVQRAIQNDPWLTMSEQKQAVMTSMGEGASSLPDPRFNAGLLSLPTDSFDYNQEAMTQVQVGVSQLIPRGDSLQLQSQKLYQQGALMPLQREQRRAEVRLTVTQLWLDITLAAQSTQLIQDNRTLFEQLTDIVGSSYSSTFGRTRQQDLVRAELELDQLDERLLKLSQQESAARKRLSEWLQPTGSESLQLDSRLPPLTPPVSFEGQSLIQVLSEHPGIRQLDQTVEIADTDIALAEQKYRPEWMINANYGFRGDDLMGNDRADLFSIGVSVDVPVFSSKRQDAQLRAEHHKRESIRTERLLAIRTLQGRYQTLEAELERLEQRLALYNERLLPGLNEAAEAAINAYTVDDGNFSEAVQARISELNAKLAVLTIHAESRKKIAELNYLLTARTGEETP